jgi:hypothetical protein
MLIHFRQGLTFIVRKVYEKEKRKTISSDRNIYEGEEKRV